MSYLTFISSSIGVTVAQGREEVWFHDDYIEEAIEALSNLNPGRYEPQYEVTVVRNEDLSVDLSATEEDSIHINDIHLSEEQANRLLSELQQWQRLALPGDSYKDEDGNVWLS